MPASESGLDAQFGQVHSEHGHPEGEGAEQRLPADEYSVDVSAVCDAAGGRRTATERLSDSDAGLLLNEGIHLWRAVLLGDQPEHRFDGGDAVLLAARMGGVGVVSLSRVGP